MGSNGNNYIFVHIPRTGGTYTINLLHKAGYKINCPWSKALNRDYTEAELIRIIEDKECNILHSHSIAFNEYIIKYAKQLGWKVFTIVRDPVDQLISIYIRFCQPYNETINQFFENEANNPCPQWIIPDWYELIDVIIQYGWPLRNILEEHFTLNSAFENACEVTDENKKRSVKSNLYRTSALRLRESEYYQRYIKASSRKIKNYGNVKLSDRNQKIVELYDTGEYTQVELGSIFNLDVSRINRILSSSR